MKSTNGLGVLKKAVQVALIVFGVLLVQGALGASDNFNISFAECLIRCGIGMAMIVAVIWIPRITHVHNRKKKAPRVAATTQEGQSNKNIN